MRKYKERARSFTKVARVILPAMLAVLVSLNTTGCISPQQPGVAISPSPSTAADDLVYFADPAGWIHALRSDGAPLWRYSLADGIRAQKPQDLTDLRIDRLIARSDKQLYGLARVESGGQAGSVILFALDGDHLRWFQDVTRPEPNGSPVAVGDSTLYLAGNDGTLYAYARDDGHKVWQYVVGNGRIGAPSLGGDGIVYLTGPRHNLHAIGPDGKQIWTANTGLQ